MIFFNLVIVCGLLFLAIRPVSADPALQSQAQTRENSYKAIWEKWQPLAEGFVARRAVPERLTLAKEGRRAPATQLRARSGRDRRPWERLSLWFYTDEPGLYSVDLNDISDATGIHASLLHAMARSGRLSFQNGGDSVSWYYDANERRILFAGEAYETFYAEGNAYQFALRWTRDPHMMTVGGNRRAQVPAGQLTPFRETLHFEEETDMMFFLWLEPINADARYWFWDYLYGSTRPRLDIPLYIPDPADDGSARIRVRLHGFTDLYPDNDHRIVAELNGSAVGGVLEWDGLNPAELVAEFDQILLNADGNNVLTLISLHDAARPKPGQLLESIDIEYHRLPVAGNGCLWMRNVVQGIQAVTGFASEDIVVIESPVRKAVLRRDINIYQNWDGDWAVSFQAAAGKDYLVAELSSVLDPVIDAREKSGLTASSNAAQYLIIAPREFAGTAQALAEYRQTDYGQVQIAWLDEIYKEFSDGRVDPFAVSRFMDYALKRWALAPSTVTLVGKGSLDRKDRMGYGDNFLPVLMTSNPWAITPSDARLLGVDDGIAPFAYGRMPITNDAEGLAYVEKIRAHELLPVGEAPSRAVVAADNPDSGGDFHAAADRLSAQLADLGFAPVTKLYHPNHAVRADFIRAETWESGLVSFSGHGSTWRLGTIGENFLYVDDAVALSNAVYPVFAALTCAAGSDALPGTRSLAGTLVLNPAGGAIAALASTGWSLNEDAHILGSAFVDQLFGRYSTVGDALSAANYQTRGQINDFMPQ